MLEEYFRFIKEDENSSVTLKQMRHLLVEIEQSLGAGKLLENRDTENDCFASINRPEEMTRAAQSDILAANFKRAQEAGRVIEEYSKLSTTPAVSENAKKIRFSLYALEKKVGSVDNGQKEN